ncbi:MAG: hypothetical protein AAF460_09970 [Pseudomonadota bacterium]
MHTIQFNANHSLGVIGRILLVLAVLLGALFSLREPIMQFYLEDTLTETGLVINGAIIALFALGLLVLFWQLVRLNGEERALAQFFKNIQSNASRPLAGLDSHRLIADRYLSMETLYRKHMPIDHGALASILVARESGRFSFPRFINNILILTGVFGTIVSLAIALSGASDILNTEADLSGMNTVVEGMSTALSTTVTAIVCFLIFGYAFIKASDAQTRLIATIEAVTLESLMPRFHISAESVNAEITQLVQALQDVVKQIGESQQRANLVEQQIEKAFQGHDARMAAISSHIRSLENLLKQGFRLNPSD